MFKFLNFVAKEVFLRLNQGQRRKEVAGSMEKAPKKYSSLKEVPLVTLVSAVLLFPGASGGSGYKDGVDLGTRRGAGCMVMVASVLVSSI